MCRAPRNRLLDRCALVATVTLAAMQFHCASGPPEPVEIALDEEICSHCRMAVSQRRFAGEVVTPGAPADYFDDIGCLAQWVSEKQLPDRTGVFVVDYESGDWLRAPAVHYVRSARFPSPMGFGLVAVAERARAAELADEFDGRVLSWEQALRGEMK